MTDSTVSVVNTNNKLADRPDLVLEDRFTADGSGLVETEWYSTDGAGDVIVTAKFHAGSSQSFTIEHGMWYSNDSSVVTLLQESLTVTSMRVVNAATLRTRWFRITASGAGASDYLYVTIRKV